MMTVDQVSEKICTEVENMVDSKTLSLDISLRDTAQIYRELASACLERANCLDHEADAQDGLNDVDKDADTSA